MNRKYFSIAVLSIVVLLFAVPIFFAPPGKAPVGPGLTLMPPRAELPAFELRDQHNRAFNPARLRGQWSLLFFGYTYCPDVCPMTLAILKQVHQLLGDKNKNIQYVFISVDPDRDTPTLMGNYTGYFHPDFLGVSGPVAELDKLVKAMGVYYRLDTNTQGNYPVDHSAAVFLVDPQARMRGLFSAPQNAQDMADNLRRLETF